MSVVCMGELLIDFVAMETGISVGDAFGFEKTPGGAPANVAVGLARLGIPATFIGQVGDDPFGHFLADVLEAEGVDIRGLRFSDQARTALAFVALAEGGERSFVFYRNPSADMLMTPGNVALECLDDAKIFHFGSITLIDEPSRSATLHAVKAAQARGLMISYDPNLRLALWPSAEAAQAGMLSGLDFAHVVKISDDEMRFLTGGDDVAPLWRENTRLIVVTHGAEGATAYPRDEQPITVPGLRVDPVDTTGAGDSFVAGLLSGLLSHPADYAAHLPEILRFANACGALTTTQRGAIPALPLREQVEARISG